MPLREVLSLQPMIPPPNKRFDIICFPLGYSEVLDAFRFKFKNNNVIEIIIKDKTKRRIGGK